MAVLLPVDIPNGRRRMEQVSMGPTVELSRGASRLFWLAAGYVFFTFGAVGLILPVMPTTVFWILAAGCFAKSSARMHGYILRCPVIGPSVADFLNHGVMPRRAKVFAWVLVMVSLEKQAGSNFMLPPPRTSRPHRQSNPIPGGPGVKTGPAWAHRQTGVRPPRKPSPAS